MNRNNHAVVYYSFAVNITQYMQDHVFGYMVFSVNTLLSSSLITGIVRNVRIR